MSLIKGCYLDNGHFQAACSNCGAWVGVLDQGETAAMLLTGETLFCFDCVPDGCERIPYAVTPFTWPTVLEMDGVCWLAQRLKVSPVCYQNDVCFTLIGSVGSCEAFDDLVSIFAVERPSGLGGA